MKARTGRILKTFLKISISLVALIFVFSKIEINTVLRVFKNSDIFLLILALISFILSKWIAAYRLNIFFAGIEVVITGIQNLRLYLLGMFYNLFLPGGIGGDGYKIYILHKRTEVRTGKIFWAVLTDRLSGVFALFSLAILLGYFIELNTDFNYKYILWIAIPVGAIIFYLVIRKFASYLTAYLTKTSILSVFVQSLQLLSAFLIFRALGGVDSESEYLFIFLISSIVAMFPVSIGGVGLRELTFLYGSRFLFLDEGLSVAMSLTFYLITVFTSFWGIYYSIRTEKVGI